MKTAWTEKCFNSTLVQLKGISTSLFFWDILQFQFYLSSIKRSIAEWRLAIGMEFQFYLSSIKRKTLDKHEDYPP